MVVLAQLVRARPCGGRGRRFEPGIPPQTFFLWNFSSHDENLNVSSTLLQLRYEQNHN